MTAEPTTDSSSVELESEGVMEAVGPIVRGILTCDSGASHTYTGVKEDFISLDISQSAKRVIMGIAKGLAVEGEGIVQYVMKDTEDKDVHIQCKALYVPALGDRRLLSPRDYRTKEGNPALFITPTHDDEDPDTMPEFHVKPNKQHWTKAATLQVVRCSWNPKTSLPVVQATIPGVETRHKEVLNAALDLTDKANCNLSDSQKSLFMLHFKLGHLGFRQIQWMIRTGRIKVRNAKRVQDTLGSRAIVGVKIILSTI